jgi:hypothetical protein
MIRPELICDDSLILQNFRYALGKPQLPVFFRPTRDVGNGADRRAEL